MLVTQGYTSMEVMAHFPPEDLTKQRLAIGQLKLLTFAVNKTFGTPPGIPETGGACAAQPPISGDPDVTEPSDAQDGVAENTQSGVPREAPTGMTYMSMHSYGSWGNHRHRRLPKTLWRTDAQVRAWQVY